MSDTSKQYNSTKPSAMALPKGGFFEDKVEQGRYGPIFPRTPANYGFSILAKIIPGREKVFHEYGKTIEKTIASLPDALAVLKLHYLRWVLFDIKGETYFMYQGIFDTDFDKYLRRRRDPFYEIRHEHRVRKPRGLPRGLEDKLAGRDQVRPRSSVSEFLGICGISLRDR